MTCRSLTACHQFASGLRRRPVVVRRIPAPSSAGAAARKSRRRRATGGRRQLPHGTTIVALKYPGGVLIAGDRRATQGNMIASRDMEKVYITDDYTAAGIAGTAAIAVEFVRLFAVELEHYEKIEGVPLTFDGKVNRLAIMVRGNLAAAMQGLVACRCWPATTSTPPTRTAPGASCRSTRRAAGTSRKRATSRWVGLDVRQVVDEEALLAGHRRRFGAAGRGGGAVRRRRRRLRYRRSGPGARHLPDGGHHRRRRCGRGAARAASPSWPASVIESRSRADTFGPDGGEK